MQSPKRKALPSFPNSGEIYSEQSTKRLRPVYRDDEIRTRPVTYQVDPRPPPPYQAVDTRVRPGAQPPQQVIDLTSSPYRPPLSGDRSQHVPVRSYSAANPQSGHEYVSVPLRQSPIREGRVAYYEVPANEQPYTHRPVPGLYERRVPPAREYVPLRDERQRLRVEGEGSRYLRSGVKYVGQ